MSPADAAMPFPQYAVAVAVGLLILAVYFVLIAVTVARLRCWRERKPARRTARPLPPHLRAGSIPEGQHRP